MNILICDEKEEFVDEWKGRLLKVVPQNKYMKIKTSTNIADAKEIIHNLSIDIAFIDTEINGESAIELVQYLRFKNSRVAIIFVSNHYEHISQAFQIRAFQFLFKDTNDEILESEFKHAIQYYKKHRAKCVLHTDDGVETFLPSEILYIETRNRKIKMMTTRGAFYGEIENLAKLKNNLLEFNYYQIHQSYFLNLNYILSMKKGEVQLTNGEVLPTSILNRKIVKEKIEYFLMMP